MRTVSSCSKCRSRKKRCIPSRAGQSCQLCTSKGFRCDAPAVVRKIQESQSHSPETSRPLIPLAPGPQGTTRTIAPELASRIVVDTLQDQSVCDELLGLYFEIIHVKQHILFHRQSFLDDQKNGQVPKYLVLGTMALAARFSSNPLFDQVPPWSRGKPFLNEAVKSFNERTKLISVEALQGCILLAFSALVEGDIDQDALLNCQAIRMTQALQLPTALSTDRIRQEVEINLYWQVWMMDCWTSVRAQLPQQLRSDSAFLRPLEEVIFDQLRPTNSVHSQTDTGILRTSGLWTMILPITQYHAQIVKLNYDIVHEPAFEFRIRNVVRDLTSKLDHWVQSLPSTLRNTPENLTAYIDRGYGRTFAVMHIIYHHTSQLLYYQFLNQCVPSLDNGNAAIDEEASTYAELCKAHATALSKLMWALYVSPTLDGLWSPVNGHLLVIASTIHLHTMLLGAGRPEAANAKKLLEQNFILLQQLQKYWPSTELAFSRLHAFHRACRMSSISTTFNMDQWMANFLNRYDQPVEDRDIYAELAEDMGPGRPADNELWDIFFNSEG